MAERSWSPTTRSAFARASKASRLLKLVEELGRLGLGRTGRARRGWLACSRSTSPPSGTTASVLALSEVGTLPVVASDRRQARTAMQYVAGSANGRPMLASLVTYRMRRQHRVQRLVPH
jgi:hypothetical protein